MNRTFLKPGQDQQDEKKIKKGKNEQNNCTPHQYTIAVYLDHSQNPKPQGDF